jgi:hypothetical protein
MAILIRAVFVFKRMAYTTRPGERANAWERRYPGLVVATRGDDNIWEAFRVLGIVVDECLNDLPTRDHDPAFRGTC